MEVGGQDLCLVKCCPMERSHVCLWACVVVGAICCMGPNKGRCELVKIFHVKRYLEVRAAKAVGCLGQCASFLLGLFHCGQHTLTPRCGITPTWEVR